MATTAAPTATNGTAPAEAPAPPDPKRFGEPGTGTLDERIARIAGLVHVHADGSMTAGRGAERRTYKYASIDAMSAALAPLMAAEGLTIAPVKVKVWSEKLEREKDGDRGTYVQVRHLTTMRVTWRVAAGGDAIEVQTFGKSADPEGSEKDVNQAHTFARINLFKSLFHLATGEDPEQKSAGSNGGGGGQEHTGELPDLAGASVSGDVKINADGQIGLSYSAEPRSTQQEINRFTTRVLGGRWNGDGKVYAIPEGREREALAFARHLGLVIPVHVEARYPSEPAPAEPAASQGALPGTDSGRAADPDAG